MTREEAIKYLRINRERMTMQMRMALETLVPELSYEDAVFDEDGCEVCVNLEEVSYGYECRLCLRSDDDFPCLNYKKKEDERIKEKILECVSLAGTLNDVEKVRAYLEKQKEQKPVEYLDKEKVFGVMNKLHQLGYSALIPVDSEEYKKIDEITSDVRGLLDYPIEQKPAEWSEEDEDKIENIIWSLECLKDWIRKYDTDAEHNPSFGKIDKEISWLKSLRPQPKQKWSGKDWNMLCDICGYISGSGSSSGITKEERTDWLYKLPKRFELQPHWKPSEEQMKAFEQWLIDDKYKGNSRYVYPIFKSLYEDLKKLK